MKKILLLDDDSDYCDIASKQIQKAFPKIDCRVAQDPLSTLSELSHHHFDVILLDYSMPQLDGFEFLTRLDDIYGSIKPEIIMVSATEDESVKNQALDMGCKFYFAKDDVVKMTEDFKKCLESFAKKGH